MARGDQQRVAADGQTGSRRKFSRRGDRDPHRVRPDHVQLVAEGIETADELACVTSLGAHAVQGYLLARPARGFPTVGR